MPTASSSPPRPQVSHHFVLFSSPKKKPASRTSTTTDYAEMLLDKDLDTLKDKWCYPDRPLMINQKYSYKLLSAISPDNFSLIVNDWTSLLIQRQIKEAMNLHLQDVAGCAPVDVACLKDGLPVTVKFKDGKLRRAEVNLVNEKGVNVYMVDSGVDILVSADSIYPSSTELLRLPKLSLMCRLAQVVPFEEKKKWKKYDYKSLFQGKNTSVFEISFIDREVSEVRLTCDKKDVGFEMVMNLGLADFVPLITYGTNDEGPQMLGKYPRYDYSDWIGQKIGVFGTKISKVGSNFKVHLQLHPSIMEAVDAGLLTYDSTSNDAKDFSKDIGDAVLVAYGEDKMNYRATIFQKSRDGYLVKLVDYGDFVNVQEKDMLKIPNELVEIPEAATPCYLAGLMAADPNKLPSDEAIKGKLMELIIEKNLECYLGLVGFIDGVDPREFRKCIVTLASEEGKPLLRNFGLRKPNLCKYYTNVDHEFPMIDQDLAKELFSGPSAYMSGVQYEGVVSFIENYDSICIQLEGDDHRADGLSEELTEFLNIWNNVPQLDPSSLINGTYVAARQNIEDDLSYYRAKILEACPDKDEYKVVFLDYGNYDVITSTMIKPLPSYFCKDKAFALKVSIPIKVLPGVSEDEVYHYIEKFTEEQELTVYLKTVDNLIYAWTIRMDKMLTTSLIEGKNPLVKLSMPAPTVPLKN
ncbi:Tudor domain-containing protein 1 [Folsomia candida]|uniref:Tudor domain-containing protein 1 n=2 Tax=Folsomia candida TaxID=158441 RepID=A0A226ESZ7_FOLCA|nr:Tudor domain-containing protein 1 [Folsomia candida]